MQTTSGWPVAFHPSERKWMMSECKYSTTKNPCVSPHGMRIPHGNENFQRITSYLSVKRFPWLFLHQQRSRSFRSLHSLAGAALPDSICLTRRCLFINILPLMETSETTKLNQTHAANRCSSDKKKFCIQMRKDSEQSASLPCCYHAAGYNTVFLDFFFSNLCTFLPASARTQQICYKNRPNCFVCGPAAVFFHFLLYLAAGLHSTKPCLQVLDECFSLFRHDLKKIRNPSTGELIFHLRMV